MKKYVMELFELKKRFGTYKINTIFNSLESYIRVREYTTYKEVTKEVELILIE